MSAPLDHTPDDERAAMFASTEHRERIRFQFIIWALALSGVGMLVAAFAMGEA